MGPRPGGLATPGRDRPAESDRLLPTNLQGHPVSRKVYSVEDGTVYLQMWTNGGNMDLRIVVCLLALVTLTVCVRPEHPRWRGFNEAAAKAACLKQIMKGSVPCTIELQLKACILDKLKEMEHANLHLER